MIKFEQREVQKGFLYAFFGTALFSLKSIFIKLSYQQGLETNSVLMLRMLISLPIYLLIIAYLSKSKNVPHEGIRSNFHTIVFLGFIGYFMASWFNLKGLEYISAGLERLTLFTYPAFVAILGALFFNTPLRKNIVLALMLTYLGIWIIFQKEVSAGTDNTALGVFFVMLSALSYSFYVLLGKKIINRVGSLWFTSLAMSVSSVFVLLYYSIFFTWSELSVSTEAWWYVFLLAIVSTVIPSFMLSEAIAKIGSARTGIMGTLGPVITIIIAVFILHEEFTLFHALGTALVISGVMLITFKFPQKQI